MDFIDSAFAKFSSYLISVLPSGPLTSLLAEGVVPGAAKLKRTTVPGRHPISINLTDKCSSVKPETMATSPGRISATFFIRPAMLFRLILNKANIKVVHMLSNQLTSFELAGGKN